MSTFVIAECGINHGGNINKALKMIDAAHKAGADAVKFQTYTAEKRVDKNNKLFDLLKSCELSFEDHVRLKIHSDKLGIEFFSTPFDVDSLSFLVNQLGVRTIKLASFDITNLEFLRQVNMYGKVLHSFKVILSTGMSNATEINRALGCLSNTKLTLLHCVSSYPTPEDQVNLSAISTLKYMSEGRYSVGYSDHTNDILAPSLAVLLGASVVEKHFTLDLKDDAIDNPVSVDPDGFRQMVDVIRMHEKMLGGGKLQLNEIEKEALAFRRYS